MTPFSTQNYRSYLKFLRCLSSVWIIALASCGAKHSAQMPLVEQDSIRLQAKAAAVADAERDVEVLASFGAGMSATPNVSTNALTSVPAPHHRFPRLPNSRNLKRLRLKLRGSQIC